MLVVPPPTGRYYFLDLRPGRSFVEHAVANGLQTFLLSWRNPVRNSPNGTSTPTLIESSRRSTPCGR